MLCSVSDPPRIYIGCLYINARRYKQTLSHRRLTDSWAWGTGVVRKPEVSNITGGTGNRARSHTVSSWQCCTDNVCLYVANCISLKIHRKVIEDILASSGQQWQNHDFEIILCTSIRRFIYGLVSPWEKKTPLFSLGLQRTQSALSQTPLTLCPLLARSAAETSFHFRSKYRAV